MKTPLSLLIACFLLVVRVQGNDAEIKLVVPSDRIAAAVSTLKLSEAESFSRLVCFFDTPDGALAARGLILRARQKHAGADGNASLTESTVKLRWSDPSPASRQTVADGSVEVDWTSDTNGVVSKSLQAEWPAGKLENVLSRTEQVRALFTTAQQDWVNRVMSSAHNFAWTNLRTYGPIRAKVWKRDVTLPGYSPRVTAERWRLEKQDRQVLELLEISTKIHVATGEEEHAVVESFFAAAATAGLGRPVGETKTRLIFNALRH